LNLTVLGSQGAIPKKGMYSTCFLLNIAKTNVLIDCCEGVQFQLRKNKIKFSRIDIILISHAHGDHYFGLIGLISTMSLLRREKKLSVYCPTSVLKIIQAHIKFSKMKLSYELELHALTKNKSVNVFENDYFNILTIPLNHSIYTNGFLFKEKPKKRKLILESALENDIDKIYFNKLTKGYNVKNRKGVEISFLKVTKDGDKPKSFAYCSDTAYSDKIIDYIQNVDLLYCETTYLLNDQDKAIKTLHSTTIDAGTLATKSNVGKLLIGHFSSRYENNDLFYKETHSIFPNVILSEEGKKIDI